MNDKARYDYIITGTGCAGLSLVMHMIHSGQFADKKILLVDKEKKVANDRTWCFWETKPGLFDPVVYQRWENIWFHSPSFSSLLAIRPYTYKLIRGIDFYEHCFSVIAQQKNIEVLAATVEAVHSGDQNAWLIADGQRIEAGYLFNSILFEKPQLAKKDQYLLQHFKGWVIETANPVFKTNEATLMDFRVSQEQGATFVYVMPFSETKALVEYTLFTAELLDQEEYNKGLESYIREQLGITAYNCIEEEFGIIPMTDYAFPLADKRVIHIGTAGGQTKASSGYTFQFIQKHSAAIVKKLLQNEYPLIKSKKRFDFYDSTFLSVLSEETVPASEIFSLLFRKNKPQQVLRFLDNESSVKDELKIISSLPTLPFLKAALKQI